LCTVSRSLSPPLPPHTYTHTWTCAPNHPHTYAHAHTHPSMHMISFSLRLNKKFWKELITYFPSYETGHTENDVSNNSSIVACVFVTTVTFLPSCCLATIREFLPSHCLATTRGFFTKPLPSNNRGILPSHGLATIRGFYRAVAYQRFCSLP
jgi:hypothetical protein